MLIRAMQKSAWEIGADGSTAAADLGASAEEDAIIRRVLRESAQEAWIATVGGCVEDWTGLVDCHPHRLRRDPRARHTCDVCGDTGTLFRCTAGCDYDVCDSCWVSRTVQE